MNQLTRRMFLRHAGFSLVELLVVLVMLGLLAGVSAPSLARYYDNLEYRREAGEIAGVLRYARLTSVSRGREVRLTLDGSEGRALRLSGAVEELRQVLNGGDRLIIRPAEIIFYPEGGATPGTLVFTRGERSRTILVDPLTGLPVKSEE